MSTTQLHRGVSQMKNDALSGSLIAAVRVYQKKAEGSCKTGITSAARC